jgi:hypothetical protein
MSYSGTVYCSHCHGKGHNKRGCPKLKQYIAENPDSWAARSATAAHEQAQKRRCSYCAKVGHNRRGCTEFKARVAGDLSASRRYRRDFVKEINKLGLTPGALVVRRNIETYNRQTQEYVTHEQQVCQLLEIAWNLVDFRAAKDNYLNPNLFVFAPVAGLFDRDQRFSEGFTVHPSASFPSDIKNMQNAHYAANWELVSRSSGSASPPDGFVSDDGYIKRYLKDCQSSTYNDNKWADR